MEFYDQCIKNERFLLAQKLEYAMSKDTFQTVSEWINGIRIWLYQTAVGTGLMNLGELEKTLTQLNEFYVKEI